MNNLVLLFEGRTGSSMFGNMLNQHPNIGFLGEEVAHLRDRGWEAQASWMDDLFSDPAAREDPRLTPLEQLQVVGFKVKLREVASSEGLRESLVKHRAYVIHMTRSNLVKQAVSSIRATDLYHSSGRYNLERGEEDLIPGRYAIPLERFDRTLTWLESHVIALDRFVSELPLPVLRVRYEEVSTDPEATMSEVCAWLGLPATKVFKSLLKVTSDDLSDVISNYEEIATHYRNTRFAVYFD